GVLALDVAEADVVDLARVLVAPFRLAGVKGRGGGEIVNVLEAELAADGVVVGRRGGRDGGVDRRGGRAPLVAGHAARLATQAVDGDARRKGDRGQGVGGGVVTGDAADHRPGRRH